MFVIDYVKETTTNEISVPPFHTGHLGLIPGTKVTATLLQSISYAQGCEVCITPYQQSLDSLFHLKCILSEQRGVVHRLLRAIAAMKINILSLESATLESKNGHGVYMLLDWGTTATPRPVRMPKNIENIFFPKLSGIIPSHDLRYLVLLRQILGQCADVLLWTNNTDSGDALPRLAVNEFDEDRRPACLGSISVARPLSTQPARLSDTGVVFELEPKVAAQARMNTGRDSSTEPMHYILLSDIESKTLRLFIPRKGRERRMIHLGFSHKNRPGALCAITELIAVNGLSIVSGLIRKQTDERNIVEATLEHESRELSSKDLVADPERWASEHISKAVRGQQEMLRYYEVALEPPMYPKKNKFKRVELFDRKLPLPEEFIVVSPEQAEKDARKMRRRMKKEGRFRGGHRLTDLLLSEEWGANGKPSLFLSYPRSGKSQAEVIKRALDGLFHIIELQKADTRKITRGALKSIRSAQCFIGIWHPDAHNDGSLSPWMPFEYGAAMVSDKPYIVLCHSSLPQYITDRIDRDTARILYTDLEKEKVVVEDVVRRCEEWRAAHRRLTV